MKHLIIILFAVLLTACGKPEFEFSLHTSGNVAVKASNLNASFDVKAANVFESSFDKMQCLPIDCDFAEKADKWLDDYVQNQIKGFGKGAAYRITADGYILEKSTGLQFSVHKTWTNDTTYLDAVCINVEISEKLK